jgi:hypothetical protein
VYSEYTPDDGWRNCPKHVVSCQNKICEISVSGWFYYKEIHKISTGGNTQQGSGACYCIELIDSKTKIHEVMMSLQL